MDLIVHFENWDDDNEHMWNADSSGKNDECHESAEEKASGSTQPGSPNKRRRVGNAGNSRPNSNVDRNVSISNDSRNLIMNTLRGIHGENFSLANTEIMQSKRKHVNQCEMNSGNLALPNPRMSTHRHNVNPLLLENLGRFGFHTDHCCEVLAYTNNDIEKSIQILSNNYFDLNFECKANIHSKNVSKMDDELAVLKFTYNNIVTVEEMEKYKHWLFHMELQYLAEWYFKNRAESENTRYRRDKPTKRFCFSFSNNGTCRYGANCKFPHIRNADEPKRSWTENTDWTSKAGFDLEIRFPDGCKYPQDVPLILFGAQHPEFPSITCLHITRYLVKEAVNSASRGYSYCHTLLEILRNSDKVLGWLNNENERNWRIDPQMPLTKFDPEEENGQYYDENMPSVNYGYESRQEPPNRDDEIISSMLSKISNPKYKVIQTQRKQLPAWNCKADILDVLNRSQVVVIVGDTGCGKTTQIPQFILDDWLFAAAGISGEETRYERVEIVCTQPRRLSAIGVSTRVAQERIEKPGQTVGYQIRLESCTSSLTKLLFCTTGILLKKLESDPVLKSVTHVIVDEVHERSEESDFLLLILKEILKIRPDLKILLMSATLNAELFSAYFDGAPLIEIPGKMYPVTELYLEEILERIDYTVDEYSKSCRKINKSMSRQLDNLECDLRIGDNFSSANASRASTPDECLSPQQMMFRYKDFSKQTKKTLLLLDPDKLDVDLIVSVLNWIVDGDHNYPREGSILVFLPGLSDIMGVNDELMKHPILSPRQGHFIIIPLHSSISNEEQSAVFRKCARGVRKIVLSTNIAETSITIDDCVFVIDSGKMKETRFDSDKNMSSLEMMWISKANAKQRKGRAGRVMPGLCIRLYSKNRHEFIFANQPVPEIQRVALDQVILRTRTLQNFKHKTISEVLGEVIQPPDSNSIETAIERLKDIGALDADQKLTPLGRHLAVLPVDVKIGKLILFGAVFCCLDSVLTIAASLSNKSPFLSPFAKREEAERKKKQFALCNSDHLTVLNAYNKWHSIVLSRWQAGKRFAEENFLSWKTLEMIGDLKHQYLDLLVSIGFASVNPNIRRRQHEDCVLQLTSRELNENGDNNSLLAGILCAALYPNLVKIIIPERMYGSHVNSSIPIEYDPGELRFMTKDDGFVYLHPSSVNYNASNFTSPYLVFQEKMKTSKIFIHDSTMASTTSLTLFAGNELKIEFDPDRNTYTASMEDGWLEFPLRCLEDAQMLQCLRSEFNKLLAKKVENPYMNLSDDAAARGIISTIVHLI